MYFVLACSSAYAWQTTEPRLPTAMPIERSHDKALRVDKDVPRLLRREHIDEQNAQSSTSEPSSSKLQMGTKRRGRSCTEHVIALLETNKSSTSLQQDHIMGECMRHAFTREACAHAVQLVSKPKDLASNSRQIAHQVCRVLVGEEADVDVEVVGALLERATVAHSSEHSSMDAVYIPKARLVKPTVECASVNKALGVVSTLGACVDRVHSYGGKYFIYGKSSKRGQCFMETTKDKRCPEGWRQTPSFDFYSVDTAGAVGACERPVDFCFEPGAVYEVQDCDDDGVPDPFCYGPAPGQSGFLSSKRSCVDTSPLGNCFPRELKPVSGLALEGDEQGKDMCVSSSSINIRVKECLGHPEDQSWHFAGPYLRVMDGKRCIGEDIDTNILALMQCVDSGNMHWYLDNRQRLKNKLGDRCATWDPVRNHVKMTMCLDDENQKFMLMPLKHCVWSHWGEWGDCSSSCGQGEKLRYRFVAAPAEKGGRQCKGKNFVVEDCRKDPCSVDCLYSAWQMWGDCTQSCNNGIMERIRTVVKHSAFGGKACDAAVTHQLSCNDKPCPQDCHWDPWTDFQECTEKCGGGVRKRSREVNVEALNAGRECDGDREESVACNVHSCPVNCKWSEWSQWNQCTHQCGGGGVQKRQRVILVQAATGGKSCEGDLLHTKNCGGQACLSDCMWEEWSEWSECAQSCGHNGKVVRRRGKRVEAAMGGQGCLGSGNEEAVCNYRECPIDCRFAPWEAWSPCFKAVKNSEVGCWKRRIRSVLTGAEFGGSQCLGGDYHTDPCGANQPNCKVQPVQVVGEDRAEESEQEKKELDDEEAAVQKDDEEAAVDKKKLI